MALLKKITVVFMVSLFMLAMKPADSSFKIALLKYNGGGDWYSNLETSLPNLIKYCNEKLGMNINPEQAIVEVGSPEIFNYPFVHATGHGNIIFTTQESQNLRNYLLAGGFLHISDNFGMNEYIRREMKKVFPEVDFVEVPFNHPIYHQKFDFNNGLPKVHLHEGKPAQGFGIFWQGRMVCFYDYECDLGDGWESIEVHKDSPENHERALKMGANILSYCFSN